MMEEAKRKLVSFFFFFFFFFFFHLQSGFAKPLEYQTLVVKPLSKPASLDSLEDFSWSESYTKTLTTNQEDLFSSPQNAPTASLHLPLLHRDSLASNSTTAEQLLHLRLQRDVLRVQSLSAIAASAAAGGRNGTTAHVSDFSSSVVSGLSQGSGEYFTRLGIGTPPRYAFMVLDTGSDIVWIQCAPCKKCYTQADPVFNPGKSTTFSRVRCGSPLCRRLDVSGCGRRGSCLYQVSYGDGSFTVGEFSTETLTFRGTKVGGVALGCGHDNEGLFVGAAGLLGLGRGGLSFPSQAGQQFSQKFSYCLVDRTSSSGSKSSSAIIFGNAAIPRSAVFTPMLSNPRLDTFYYVGLTGISVGGARVASISEASFRLDAAGNGGVIVDSGTSVTRLVRPAYNALRDAFVSGAAGLKRTAGYSLFDTCYDLSGLVEVKVPTVVLHFGRGADLSLPASNYLIPVNTMGTFCFAFAGTSSGLSIIGNIQQQGFRVAFDAAGSRVGFAPRGCA